jgi:hypothetical protein
MFASIKNCNSSHAQIKNMFVNIKNSNSGHAQINNMSESIFKKIAKIKNMFASKKKL